MNRILSGVKNTTRELKSAFCALSDARSRCILARDIILFHAMVAGLKKPNNSTRIVKFKMGATIHYGLNEGDIQSVREVMLDEIYRLPSFIKPSVIVDLGGNIGLTSVFYHWQYKCSSIICVEPVFRNVQMIEENLRSNGVRALVLQAAASSAPGSVRFKSDGHSNLGRVNEDGDTVVSCITMDEILQNTPENWIDVLKIDIEGHEQVLLSENNSWLKRVGVILIEFHPWLVDYPGSVEVLKANGFRYYPPAYTRKSGAWEGSTDLFVRQPHL
jgi:FkbM family methyltransferase